MARNLLFLLLILLVGCNAPPQPGEPLSATELLSSLPQAGFARADKPREFNFPRDHGGHPAYRNEWWYFTGNLFSESGRRFGYQVTFFRFALQPDREGETRSNWASRQIWMAHVAITDAENGRHLAEERLVRAGPGLAGVQSEPFRVWLEDWQLSQSITGFPWRIDIQAREFTLQLAVEPTVGVILQGDAGLSQKSAQPGNASYYYSLPRLQSRGELTLDGQRHRLAGLSWLDREWGTSALGPMQSGWDWFSLQLDSGDSLMFYRLRDREGGSDPHSAGSWVDRDGAVQHLNLDQLSLSPTDWWQSPAGRRYPIAWTMALKPESRRFEIRAVVDDQEMDLSVVYWEGAVDVFENGQPVGRGYLEMTGY